MQPVRRDLPARPLLSFPPAAPHPPLPSRSSERPRSTLFKVVAFLPLVFIFALLAFAAYAVLYSLCLEYLLLRRRAYAKGTAYFLVYSWLLYGCGGSFWMAYWRGGGIVPGAGEYKRGDEEARVQNEGIRGDVGRFVLGGGDEALVPEQEADEEEVDEAREEQGLLDPVTLPSGSRETWDKLDTRDSTRPAMLQVKSDGSARFCRKCNIPKPDRAHHCSSCRRCVLKMDHHCPWLGGGCVGWANYKFFLLSLWYTGALGLTTGAILFHELFHYVNDNSGGYELAPIPWALAALLGCIFGFAVGSFGLYHLYLACKNRTTIEAMEHPNSIATLALASASSAPPSSAASHAMRRLQPIDLTYQQRRALTSAARALSIYDLGTKENLKQIFGDKWWEWGMPWGWPPGDGQTFPINSHNLSRLRRATEQIYAEAAATRYESRGGEYELETGSTTSGMSDEDGPVRRA
ncbi:DHHC family palmitoyltransferase [Rhodotorula paludigena]|uniref:DHHC family palmitoyltransferase n=1 Tax=Rhodotorula paludigena TaxID=86838 RepID=UPI00317412C0